MDAPPGGVVAALLVGAKASTSDAIAFTDDDAVPEPDWLDRLSVYVRDPSIGGVGGRIRHVVDGVESGLHIVAGPVARITWYGRTVSHLFDHPDNRIIEDVDFLPGANMCFRKEAISQVRPELDYGMAPGMELEFAFAAKHLGWRVVYDSTIVVNHNPAPRGAGHQRGDTVAYCKDYSRSLAFVFAGWLPWARLATFTLYFLIIGQKVAPGVLRATLLLLRSPLSALKLVSTAFRGTVLGLRDGLRTRSI